jgi:hypothetical protein
MTSRRDAPSDTAPEARARLIAGYRAMSPARKLQCVAELNRALQELAPLDIRWRHPQADERELRMRLAFGWDVREHGW